MASSSGPGGYAIARDEASSYIVPECRHVQPTGGEGNECTCRVPCDMFDDDDDEINDIDDDIDIDIASTTFVRYVDGMPYLPLLYANIDDENTILDVASIILSYRHDDDGNNNWGGRYNNGRRGSRLGCRRNRRRNRRRRGRDDDGGEEPPPRDDDDDDGDGGGDGGRGRVTRITGGLTNALFRVDWTTSTSSSSSSSGMSVLVRIFGCDGCIDRDDETHTLALLCRGRRDGCDDDYGHGDGGGGEGGMMMGNAVITTTAKTTTPTMNNTTTNTARYYYLRDMLGPLGRFGNGRVERYAYNTRVACPNRDFGNVMFHRELARQMAHFHYGFLSTLTASSDDAAVARVVNDDDDGYGGGRGRAGTAMTRGGGGTGTELAPSLWSVLHSWIRDLSDKLSGDEFRNDASLAEIFRVAIASDDDVVDVVDGRCDGSSTTTTMSTAPDDDVVVVISYLHDELSWLRRTVETYFPNAKVAFCHNDVNAANVLLHTSVDDNIDGTSSSSSSSSSSSPSLSSSRASSRYDATTVCMIDYEYSSYNYASFDVANFMCEHCGGNDDGMPNYDMLPSEGRLASFLDEYVRARDGILTSMGEGARCGRRRRYCPGHFVRRVRLRD